MLSLTNYEEEVVRVRLPAPAPPVSSSLVLRGYHERVVDGLYARIVGSFDKNYPTVETDWWVRRPADM
ncbi:hypothetical protein Cni_G04351 [Canna indica]|uniref:Uncharacterized protein n=1 Tax=Canna indica TaxID=4628 RepID=A0AAQ3JSS3_9LILI|nr:hypothetical protein Cni_G04351 [Canna indica]